MNNNETTGLHFMKGTAMIHPRPSREYLRFTVIIFLLAALALMLSSAAICQQTVKEKSTGKLFPAEIKVNNNGKEYALKCTGVAVRKKLIFKVYGIAHYMQDPGKANDFKTAFNEVLTEGKAKQIVMDFARDVEIAKIKEAYTDGFKEALTSTEFQQLQQVINQFLGYFSKDVKENERFTLRWLPEGVVTANIQGEEKPAITNGTFARALWSIWFGDDSIVDREKLVEFIVSK
jgi:hypothetical protein